jgi:hypothetical protein
MRRFGLASLAFVLGLALAVLVIALHGPTWLLLVALGAWGVAYWRYRWVTGLREEMMAARDHGLVRGLEKRRRHIEDRKKSQSRGS